MKLDALFNVGEEQRFEQRVRGCVAELHCATLGHEANLTTVVAVNVGNMLPVTLHRVLAEASDEFARIGWAVVVFTPTHALVENSPTPLECAALRNSPLPILRLFDVGD